MRTLTYTFTVTLASNGRANTQRVEEMIDLAMQDLVYDDEFIAALDESQSVTIQVTPQIGQATG